MSDTPRMPYSQAYVDALKWATQSSGEPVRVPTAFIYRRPRELVVMIPGDGDFKILCFTGETIGKDLVRFIL